MPQRTIANGGGNWNSTATWVEGAVPTSSDFVVATATSGQLTINVAASCQYLDLSAYTQTLTTNNTITLGLAAATTTFGSGMNFTGNSTGIIVCSVNHSFRQNTTNRIPNFGIRAGVFTLLTNLYVGNFVPTTGQPGQMNGNTIYISGNLITKNTISSGTFGTTNYILDGSGLISWNFGAFGGITTRTIEITGNYQTIGAGCNLNLDNTFIYTAGTAGSVFDVIIGGAASGGVSAARNTLSINQPNLNIYLNNNVFNVSAENQPITLISPLIIKDINTYAVSRTYTTDNFVPKYIFSGNSISANTLNLSPIYRSTSSEITPSNLYKSISLSLDPNYTHYIGNMELNGGGIPSNPVISSSQSGVQVPIVLGSKITTQISKYNFTDVDASGGEQIVAINGTLTNTSNITNVYPTGGGGGQTAYTFFS